MSSNENKKVQLGNGIVKPGARPLKVFVDSSNECWVCDADVAEGSDYAKEGCTASSSNPHNS